MMNGYGENFLVNLDALDGIPAKTWQLDELERRGCPLSGDPTWREAADAIAQARRRHAR